MTQCTSHQIMHFNKQMHFHEDARQIRNENIGVRGHVCKMKHLPGDSRPWQETAGGRAARLQKRSVVTDGPKRTRMSRGEPGGACSPLVPPSVGSGAAPCLHALSPTPAPKGNPLLHSGRKGGGSKVWGKTRQSRTPSAVWLLVSSS